MTYEPTLDQRERYAIHRDWTSDITDPRNARYLIPLGGMIRCGVEQVRAEDMAEEMAAAIYNAIARERFTDATSDAEADGAYFQALVDSRRMLLDPDYEHLFEIMPRGRG